jgi:hypothetical protein
LIIAYDNILMIDLMIAKLVSHPQKPAMPMMKPRVAGIRAK